MMLRPLPKVEPMALLRQAAPFDHDEWLFELKHDGVRAVAYLEHGVCKLFSRNCSRPLEDLRSALPGEIHARSAIVDGELVVLDRSGKSQFYELVAGYGTAVFAAFDLMWLDGRDLRDLPLIERKEILRFRVKHPSRRVVFVDHVEGQGKALYSQVCRRDMEGIVCKPMISPYRTIRGSTTWLTVNNPTYSKAERRAELFDKRP